MDWDWGTVPAWVGSILTGGSLLLGFYILLRDRRKAEQEQANQISYWFSVDKADEADTSNFPLNRFRVQITNGSNRPIYNPRLRAAPYESKELKRILKLEGPKDFELRKYKDAYTAGLPNLRNVFDDEGHLRPIVYPDIHHALRAFKKGPQEIGPDNKLELYVDLIFPYWLYEIDLIFSDSLNNRWYRNVTSGKLVKYTFPKWARYPAGRWLARTKHRISFWNRH